jgi:hypothetical protein
MELPGASVIGPLLAMGFWLLCTRSETRSREGIMASFRWVNWGRKTLYQNSCSISFVFDKNYPNFINIEYSMHLPTFWCDGESSFCIVKFGENRKTKQGPCSLQTSSRRRTVIRESRRCCAGSIFRSHIINRQINKQYRASFARGPHASCARPDGQWAVCRDREHIYASVIHGPWLSRWVVVCVKNRPMHGLSDLCFVSGPEKEACRSCRLIPSLLPSPKNNTQEYTGDASTLWNSYKFLYIVLTLQGYIWYEPTIILGLLFPNTPPWVNTAINSCLVKTPKTPVRKYGERVHSAA